MSEEENSGEEKEENEENEDIEGEDEEKEEKEDNEENKEEENEGNEEKKDTKKKIPKKEKKKKEKETKVINKFLEAKLQQSKEIKLDLKGNLNSNTIFGNILKNNNFLTNSIPINYSLKTLSDINNDMDLLSDKINKDIIPKFQMNSFDHNKENYAYYSPLINNYQNNSILYDKEDFEIKQLIDKTNQMLNTLDSRKNNNFQFKFFGTKNDNNIENLIKKSKNNFPQYNNRSTSISKDFYENNIYDNYSYKNTIPNSNKNYNFKTISNFDIYRNQRKNNIFENSSYRNHNITNTDNINNFENEIDSEMNNDKDKE